MDDIYECDGIVQENTIDLSDDDNTIQLYPNVAEPNYTEKKLDDVLSKEVVIVPTENAYTIDTTIEDTKDTTDDTTAMTIIGIDVGGQNMGITIIRGTSMDSFEILKFIHYKPGITTKMAMGERAALLVKMCDDYITNDICPTYIGIETQYVNRNDRRAVNFIAKDIASMLFGMLKQKYRACNVVSVKPTLKKEEGRSHEQRKNTQWHNTMRMLKDRFPETHKIATKQLESIHPCDALLIALELLKRSTSHKKSHTRSSREN